MIRIFFLLSLLGFATFAFSEEITNFYNVHVDRVYDGDTVFVKIENLPAIFGEIGVRIRGIDSAEIRASSECERIDAQKAKEALNLLIGMNSIDLVNCLKDKYFRLLCSAFSGSVSIADFMLEKGYAVFYEGEKKPAWICRS